MAGLTHPWVGLTSQNSFGLGSTQWAWEPHPKFRVTNKINIFGYRSNSKILLNLSFWEYLKNFRSKNFFVPNFFKHTQRLKFQRILKLEQQLNMLILLVTLNFGRGSHAHWVDPRPKLFWLVNPTHGLVKPAKCRQNR